MPLSTPEAQRFREALISRYPGFATRTDIIPFDKPPVRLSNLDIDILTDQARVSRFSLMQSDVITLTETGSANDGMALDLGKLKSLAEAPVAGPTFNIERPRLG